MISKPFFSSRYTVTDPAELECLFTQLRNAASAVAMAFGLDSFTEKQGDTVAVTVTAERGNERALVKGAAVFGVMALEITDDDIAVRVEGPSENCDSNRELRNLVPAMELAMNLLTYFPLGEACRAADAIISVVMSAAAEGGKLREVEIRAEPIEPTPAVDPSSN